MLNYVNPITMGAVFTMPERSTATINEECRVDGCSNPIRVGKGRPSQRCEQHQETCIVAGCTNRALRRPECGTHVARRMKEKNKDIDPKIEIERAILTLMKYGKVTFERTAGQF